MHREVGGIRLQTWELIEMQSVVRVTGLIPQRLFNLESDSGLLPQPKCMETKFFFHSFGVQWSGLHRGTAWASAGH